MNYQMLWLMKNFIDLKQLILQQFSNNNYSNKQNMFKKVFTGIRTAIGNIVKTKQERRHALVGAANVWQQAREFQFQFLLDQGLQKTDKLMDIGCGTLRGGIPMIEYLNIGNYYGMDLRVGS